MPSKDIRSDLQPILAFNTQVVSTDTTTTGGIIDTADFDNGIVFVPVAGVYTDGTYNFLIEEGDAANLSDAAAVADANLIGTEAGLALTAADAEGSILGSIGVVTAKRYLRISVVSTATTTGATLTVFAMQKPEIFPATGLSA